MTVHAQTRLTFDGALQRAMEVNNTVERTREQIGVASAQRDQLLSAVLPRITLKGDLTRNSIEQRFGEGDDSIAILPRNDWAYRIQLEQPVYAGRRELRAYSQAKLNVENAREGARGSEDARAAARRVQLPRASSTPTAASTSRSATSSSPTAASSRPRPSTRRAK